MQVYGAAFSINRMARFLVTGCAGFIGSSLVTKLLELGHDVVGLDNLSAGFSDNLTQHPQFTFITGDIRDLKTCRNACAGVEFVLHEAALGSVPLSMEEPILYTENNINGTLNMLIAARDAGVKRFVFASSSAVYGDDPILPKIETMLPSPKSPYAISKITGEYYCNVFNESFQLQTVSLRYFNIFGPRQNPNSQYAAVIPKFITAYLANTPPTIYGNGEQTRDFAYIDNVIQANIASCFAPENVCGKAYNIGCGERISLNRLAQIIKTQTQSQAKVIYEEKRAGDIQDSLASIKHAQEQLGIKDFITLEEGLQKTISWYK